MFSKKPNAGKAMKKKAKYIKVTNKALSIKGLSTISCPIQPKHKALQKKNQNNALLINLN